MDAPRQTLECGEYDRSIRHELLLALSTSINTSCSENPLPRAFHVTYDVALRRSICPVLRGGGVRFADVRDMDLSILCWYRMGPI